MYLLKHKNIWLVNPDRLYIFKKEIQHRFLQLRNVVSDSKFENVRPVAKNCKKTKTIEDSELVLMFSIKFKMSPGLTQIGAPPFWHTAPFRR